MCTVSRWQAVQVIAPRAAAAKAAMATLSQSIERGRLRHVLAAVLTAGNLMNAGTAKGQADGFKAVPHAVCLVHSARHREQLFPVLLCMSRRLHRCRDCRVLLYAPPIPQPCRRCSRTRHTHRRWLRRTFLLHRDSLLSSQAVTALPTGHIWPRCGPWPLQVEILTKLVTIKDATGTLRSALRRRTSALLPDPWASRRRIHRARPRHSRLAWR